MSRRKRVHEVPRLPDHESGLRSMHAESHGQPYQALHTLEEAKSFPEGVVILEGDEGGQIYVVVPAVMVKCDISTLEQLLEDLDAIAWPENDPDMRHIFYERHPIGSGVPGGMGGAVSTGTLWIHEGFRKLRLDSAIQEIIEGKRKTLK